MKSIDKLSDSQATILRDEMDFDGPEQQVVIRIAPNGGPYKGGAFKFSIDLTPQINLRCLTPVRLSNTWERFTF